MMENFFFGVVTGLILLKYFFLSVVSLGASMIAFAVSLSLFLSYSLKSWYGVLSVLVFISGMMVICFYVLSVDFNPNSCSPGSKLQSSVLVSGGLVLFGAMGMFLQSPGTTKKFFLTDKSIFLFLASEIWAVVFLTFFLLFVMWVMTKLVFKNSTSGLRPFF